MNKERGAFITLHRPKLKLQKLEKICVYGLQIGVVMKVF